MLRERVAFEHFVTLCHTKQWFVTLSKILSTELADLSGNTNEVYSYIYKCSPMLHEFFRVFGVQFEALS